MTAYETIGFFYICGATGLFTAQLLILAGYSFVVGVRTLWRWLRQGEAIEAKTREMVNGR